MHQPKYTYYNSSRISDDDFYWHLVEQNEYNENGEIADSSIFCKCGKKGDALMIIEALNKYEKENED